MILSKRCLRPHAHLTDKEAPGERFGASCFRQVQRSAAQSGSQSAPGFKTLPWLHNLSEAIETEQAVKSDAMMHDI